MYLSNEQLTAPILPNLAHSSIPFQVHSLLEQGSGELNEDVLLKTGDTFGVFDGATSLDRRRFDEELTGGLLAARTAARVYRQGGASLYSLAVRANDSIREEFLGHNVSLAERHLLWSTSMAVVRLTGSRLEYCQTGDALIILVGSDGSHRVITSEVDIDRETLALFQETRGMEKRDRQKLMGKQIKRVREQMNKSYGVLNGEPEAVNFLRHGHLDLTGVRDILLFTDGLYLPRENPQQENDWQLLIDLYLQSGLQAVRDRVRRLQRSDPQLTKYPRFKQHDDIAAVAIKLNSSF